MRLCYGHILYNCYSAMGRHWQILQDSMPISLNIAVVMNVDGSRKACRMAHFLYTPGQLVACGT